MYAVRLVVDIGLALLADEVRWIDVVWSSLNVLFAGSFIYVAGTYPLQTTLPCENVAKADDVSDLSLNSLNLIIIEV